MSLSWEFRITRYSAQLPVPYSHTVQQHIFFSPKILACIWNWLNLGGRGGPRVPSQGLSPCVLVFISFPGTPCSMPLTKFPLLFFKGVKLPL